MQAAIRSLEYSPSGYISVDIVTGETEQNLYFQLPPGTPVHTDTVAACVALLLSKSCRSLEFDFPISEELVSTIEMYCQARVRTKGTCSLEPPLKADIGGLAFSGGFDSLTAKDFLPGAHELISLDFGGRFSRERVVFVEFGTSVVKTNLVDIGPNRGFLKR